jgi:hypothetical protein
MAKAHTTDIAAASDFAVKLLSARFRGGICGLCVYLITVVVTSCFSLLWVAASRAPNLNRALALASVRVSTVLNQEEDEQVYCQFLGQAHLIQGIESVPIPFPTVGAAL